MSVPRVIPRRGDGLATKRPGLLVVLDAGRPMWLPLEDAYALADELVEVAEQMEQRHAEGAGQ